MRSHQVAYIAAAVLAATILVVAAGFYIVRPKANQQPTTVATTSTPTPFPAEASSPSPSPTPASLVTLMFGGDIMLGRTVEARMKTYGGDWPLKKLGPTMAAADIAVANLESPLREDAATTPIDSLVLRGDPEGVASLKEAGLDLVSLANNHITDMGISGLNQTKQLLSDNKIEFAGAGEDTGQASEAKVITKNGIRFGFLSYTYGVNFDSAGVHYNVANATQAAKDIAALKPTVDMVIVLVHFGTEYQSQPNQTQKTFAHAAVDAGASLVIGAHPHVPEPVETYGSGVIFYSLGNLVFDQEQGGGRDYSALVSVTVTANKLTSIRLLPYRIYNFGQPALLETTSEKEKVWQMFGVPGGKLQLTD